MKTKPQLLAYLAVLALTLAGTAFAAGPYSPLTWPPTVDPAKKVHYAVTDFDPGFAAPNDNWTNSLFWATGSDSAFVDQQVCGPLVTFTGRKATAQYINIADYDWQFWNTQPTIDILVQVYGDDTLLIPPDLTNSRVWRFREGTTGTLVCAPGGGTQSKTVNGPAVSTNIHNFKWNWLLFQITNEPVFICGADSGNRWLGSVNPGSSGNTNYGGINGGTMRMNPSSPSSWSGLIIHALAWGESGAFGDPADVNLFEPADVVSCDPVLDQNLVGIDFNAGITNYVQVMNDLDQTVTYLPSAGPPGDLRKAVIPQGSYLNFGILGNRLGRPCNPNAVVKLCVDFYDDPAFAGQVVQFGPEAYATDQYGGACAPNGAYPQTGLHIMLGSGQWVRRSWTIAGVNLYGVNTTPLTGGPRLVCLGAPVAVSRFYLAALRTTGPLAGQDPLADCYADPLICSGVYSNRVELSLGTNSLGEGAVTDGLGLGSNSGDQTYVVEEAGPAGDRRPAVRSLTPPEYNLNFTILDTVLGPTSQGNVHLAIAVTYYDDPALAGKGFRPRVYQREFGGATSLAFLDGNPQPNMVLQGTGQWRDAYWEIGNIYLSGVNQGPQAAARFLFENLSETQGIYINRVRYAVVRPCGTTAGENPLLNKVVLTAGPETNAMVKVSWPYRAPQAQLEGCPSLGGIWSNVPGIPAVESGDQSVLRLSPTDAGQFYRVTITPP
ncbi:MAG TPA: hypothetical protein VJA21_26090 [Verrucomicrobiae bacterium]